MCGLHISAASRRHLGGISAASRRHLARRAAQQDAEVVEQQLLRVAAAAGPARSAAARADVPAPRRDTGRGAGAHLRVAPRRLTQSSTPSAERGRAVRRLDEPGQVAHLGAISAHLGPSRLISPRTRRAQAGGGGAAARRGARAAARAAPSAPARDHARSREITWDHARSPEITRDHQDHARIREMTRDDARSPEISQYPPVLAETRPR